MPRFEFRDPKVFILLSWVASTMMINKVKNEAKV
jgi:hypothetical protein